MLHDLDRTLENLIIEKGKINRNEIEISFEQPTGEWSARLSRPTINLWCYDLRENIKLRTMNRQYERVDKMAKSTFPPRRIDLSYLVTSWARKVEDEHQLLWRALAVLKRFSDLKPRDCEGELRYQTRDIPLFVANVTEAMPNMVDLWSVLDNQMRLGFILTATVELDTEIGFESPLVLESTIRVGQLSHSHAQDQDAADSEYTGEYIEIHHEGDYESFDKTGERNITTRRVVKQPENGTKEDNDAK